MLLLIWLYSLKKFKSNYLRYVGKDKSIHRRILIF